MLPLAPWTLHYFNDYHIWRIRNCGKRRRRSKASRKKWQWYCVLFSVCPTERVVTTTTDQLDTLIVLPPPSNVCPLLFFPSPPARAKVAFRRAIVFQLRPMSDCWSAFADLGFFFTSHTRTQFALRIGQLPIGAHFVLQWISYRVVDRDTVSLIRSTLSSHLFLPTFSDQLPRLFICPVCV